MTHAYMIFQMKKHQSVFVRVTFAVAQRIAKNMRKRRDRA